MTTALRQNAVEAIGIFAQIGHGAGDHSTLLSFRFVDAVLGLGAQVAGLLECDARLDRGRIAHRRLAAAATEIREIHVAVQVTQHGGLLDHSADSNRERDRVGAFPNRPRFHPVVSLRPPVLSSRE